MHARTPPANDACPSAVPLVTTDRRLGGSYGAEQSGVEVSFTYVQPYNVLVQYSSSPSAAHHHSVAVAHADDEHPIGAWKACASPCYCHSKRGRLPPPVLVVGAHKPYTNIKETTAMTIERRRRSLTAVMKLVASLFMTILLMVDSKHLRADRKLQTSFTQSFDVPLFLALHFVTESTASALETKDKTNPIVEHFCNKVHEQVSSDKSV